MDREILVGDVIDKLKDIPDESIDVMITSPPYWGLRDYGVDKQWGSEKSFRDYLDKLDKLMVEMKRVLKKTGSCWVNLGDTYSTISGGMRDISKGNTKQYGKIQYLDKGTGDREVYGVDQSKMYEGLQTKSRVGIPERFYINCIDNEWIARNHIPWHKNNPMPSSVKDRFSNKWESIFFFVKNPKYYFDLDAVRERTITREKRKTRIQYDGKSADTSAFMPPNPKGKNPGDYFEEVKSDRKHSYVAGQPPQSINVEGYHYSHPKGKNPGDVFVDTSKPYAVVEREGIIYYRELPPHKEIREYLTEARKKIGMTIDKLEEIFDNYTPHHWFDKEGSYPTVEDWVKAKEILKFDDTYDEAMLTEYPKDAAKVNDPKGKNPGDVFEDFGKYEDKETETKHRQGMNRERGEGIVEKRNLPTQKEFVDKLRGNFSVDDIVDCGLERSTVEHWFRYDESGFSYPDAEDWQKVGTDLFPELLEVYYTSDEIKQDQKGKNPGDYFDDTDNLTETGYQQNLATHDNKSLPGPNSIMWKKPPKSHSQFHERQDIARKQGADHADWANDPKGKNPGDIFNINTHPYPEAHFATFPVALPIKILKCACPKQVCKKCGKPRENEEECCNAGWEAGIVLDPFFGSGTTGVAAEKLGLRWVGIELNDEYVTIARKRLSMFRNKKLEDWFTDG